MKKLTNMQINVLKILERSGIIESFYLAGGTALTMKYDHRFSEDFDFFFNPEADADFVKIANAISVDEVLDLKKDTLIFLLNTVRVSMFLYPYPLLEDPELVNPFQIRIASDPDIACMKSIAIIQRGEKKDFFDLWYLMEIHHWGIQELIEMNKKKYGKIFNPSIFLKALVYFDDADYAKIPEVDNKWMEIKNYFMQKVKKFLR